MECPTRLVEVTGHHIHGCYHSSRPVRFETCIQDTSLHEIPPTGKWEALKGEATFAAIRKSLKWLAHIVVVTDKDSVSALIVERETKGGSRWIQSIFGFILEDEAQRLAGDCRSGSSVSTVNDVTVGQLDSPISTAR